MPRRPKNFLSTCCKILDPADGFYSAEDADSDDPYNSDQHGEGALYLLTMDDIAKRLGVKATNIFKFSDALKNGGNVSHRTPNGSAGPFR